MLKKQFLNIKLANEADKTIICFHGILNDCNSNRPVEELAKELNYNYLSYTFPMHGNNHEKNVTIEKLIEIAIEVIKLSPTKKIILFGHSAGANWVNQCIKFYGDDYFEKVVLISPINSSIKFINKNKLITFEKLIFKQKYDLDSAFKDFKNVGTSFSNYSYQETMKYILLIYKLCDKKFLLSTNVIYENTNLPIMVIAGQNDMVIDTIDSYNLFKLLNSNIEYHVFGDCGHVPHYENKELFKKLAKEFLQ